MNAVERATRPIERTDLELAFDRLDEFETRLENLEALMRDKLIPCLTSDHPIPPQDAPIRDYSATPLSERVGSKVNRMDDILDRVFAVLDRVQF